MSAPALEPTTRNVQGLFDQRQGVDRIKLVAGYAAVVLGMFMAILDIQIVASSLNEIQAGLLAAPDEIAWVQSAYLIAEVIVIPLTGYLAHVFSTRWLFGISCLGFTLASAGCAFAWNIESMIVFRAIQGFLGGTMIPTMFSTSFLIFGGSRSTTASAITAMVITMGPTLGPTLGGWLTATLSWHWLFLINLAPGILVAVLTAMFLDIDKPNLGALKSFDFPGFLAMAIFLGGTQYILEEGTKKDWFDSDLIVGATFAVVIAGAIFFYRALTNPRPIVDLRVFGQRDFALGCMIGFALGVILYGSTFLIPLYCARVLNFNAFDIGTVMAVTGACQMIGGPLSAVLVRKFDVRLVLASGLAFLAGGVYLNGDLTALSGFGDMALPQAMRGLGYMLCAMPSNVVAMSNLPVSMIRAASGLFTLTRNLGGALGLAILNTQLVARSKFHEARLADAMMDGRGAVSDRMDGLSAYIGDQLGGTLDSSMVTLRLMMGLTQRQAAALTFADLQILMSLVGGLMVVCLIFVRRMPPVGQQAAAH